MANKTVITDIYVTFQEECVIQNGSFFIFFLWSCNEKTGLIFFFMVDSAGGDEPYLIALLPGPGVSDSQSRIVSIYESEGVSVGDRNCLLKYE